MLDALRRGANSWVLKPLLLLLVLAFIVWGVADTFTNFSRTGPLATVGSIDIPVGEFEVTYRAVMNNFSRRFGRRPPADEARKLGIDRAVLEDLVNGATLDNQVRGLGLALSQSAVVGAIERDQALRGPDGRFDRAAFDNFLREIGYDERSYLNVRRREELRQQLTQALFQNLPVPAALTGLVHNWREETRTIQHFTIEPAKQVKVGEPDEAKLKEIYDSRKSLFVAPERRNAVVLVLSAAEVAKSLDVAEAEIRKAYEADVSARDLPERRRVQQIPFKDKAAAEAAAKSLAAGKSFLEVAKEAEATEKDIDLGLVTRGELVDPAVAEAAFKLAKDGVSAPISGRFATFLVRVTEIHPARVRPFEEMRQEIRDKLASTRVTEAVRKLHDAVEGEEGRSRGRPLKEIAQLLKLKLYELNDIDQPGRRPDGTTPYDGPDAAKILRAAFAGRQGVEIEPVDLDEGGYAWIDVLGVTEAKQRPFEEVKEDVKKAWVEVETSRQMLELANRLIERASKGETMTALAKEVGAKLETSRPFKRTGTDGGVPAGVVARAYGLQLGARASVETGQDGRRMLLRVVEIAKPAPPTPEQAAQIAQTLRGEMQQDAIQAYVLALRDRFGVHINEALFKRTTGETTDQR